MIEDSAKSGTTWVGRWRAWLYETFPERQIYIRTEGRVQFFIFGPSLQATLAWLTLVFLGWFSFSTVNVIFKDRIIASKDHRYQEMVAHYESGHGFPRDDYNLIYVSDALTASMQIEEQLAACLGQRCTQARIAELQRKVGQQEDTYALVMSPYIGQYELRTTDNEKVGYFRIFWRYAFIMTKNFMNDAISAATGKPTQVGDDAVAGLLIPAVFAIAIFLFNVVLRLIRGKRSRQHSKT